MKTDLVGVRKGDVVLARVAEKLSSYEYIVSIDGQLIQVQNRTLHQWAVGSQVSLLVSGVKPLRLSSLPTMFRVGLSAESMSVFK